ncbi:MAG TPA: DUF695 domain-containing protein [Patescibacteria group bacterium]
MNNNEKRFNVYKGEKDGLPVSIMADPNYQNYSLKQDYPWFLWIRIEMKDVDQQGQPSEKEDILLNDFEDRIENEIFKSSPTYFVGRVTWNKDRQIYLYTSDAKSANAVLEKIAENPTRPFEYKIEKDPEWEKVKESIGLSK